MKYNGVFFLVCAFDLCVLEHPESQVFIHDSERGISLSEVLALHKKNTSHTVTKLK